MRPGVGPSSYLMQQLSRCRWLIEHNPSGFSSMQCLFFFLNDGLHAIQLSKDQRTRDERRSLYTLEEMVSIDSSAH